MCSWCVYNFTVMIPVASTSQQPELPAACIARPNASQLMSQQVSVVYILLGQRKTYFKKFPVQDLEPEDRQLFAVEKAYRQAWEAAGVVSVMSEDATFVISKQQNPRLLDLCTEYPRHQVFNHLGFVQPITVKSQLAAAARRFAAGAKWRAKEISSLMPASYILRNPRDCLEFQDQVRSGMWIHKKDRTHNSQGVRLLTSQEAQGFAQSCGNESSRGLVQRYLPNPLLIHGRKCDFRIFLYIPSSVPLVAFSSPVWYMRCGHEKFNLSSTDPQNVVTNTKVNGKLRKGANYSELVLGPKQVQAILSETGFDSDFVEVKLAAKIKQKLTLLMEVLESQADHLKTTGYELLGVDMMLTSDLNLWLIEVNSSPGMESSLGARQTADTWNEGGHCGTGELGDLSEDSGLQVVCQRLPLLERHSSTHFVQAVNTAINRVGSKFGLCELVDEDDDLVTPQTSRNATTSLGLRRRATTGSRLNHMDKPKRLFRRRSLDLDAMSAWSAISNRGLGDKLPQGLIEEKREGSCLSSPSSSAPTIQELGLPLIFRRNSHSLMNVQKMAMPSQSSKDLQSLGSQIIAEEKLKESSTRASILDFEHLFVQYFVEVTPLLRHRFCASSDAWLAQPSAHEVVRAWKEVLVEGLMSHRQLILQHWPELQLSKEALHSKLQKELVVQDELAGPKRRVLFTLAPEQVCHRLIWALGDSIPAELALEDIGRRLQQRFPQSRIRCCDGLFWPHSVIRTLFFIATALLLFGLRAAALAAWAVYKADPPTPGKRKKVDLSGPTWEEYLDQFSARLILASSLAFFWLLYGIAAAFPLRSLHSPFKRDLGCLAAYSSTGTFLFRLVAPIAACGVPAAMAVRFDRLGLGLLVPAQDRPA
ncbi:unnamed protein product, partial [Cladocopium goreaui]